MEAGLVARAAVAASSLARDLDLHVEDVVVVQNFQHPRAAPPAL